MSTIINLLVEHGDQFLSGLRVTLLLSLFSIVASTIFGSIICLISMSKVPPLKWMCTAYIEIIRGTPILLQLYFFVFLLPRILPVNLSNLQAVMLSLSLCAAAYVSELMRAGIQAVDKGQMEGARSCGMTNAQAMRYVVMPQAVKNILPAIGNEFVTMVKETSIIQYLGIGDLMYNNGIVVTSTYNPLPCYYISAIIYLALNIILGKGLNIFEGRLRRSER